MTAAVQMSPEQLVLAARNGQLVPRPNHNATPTAELSAFVDGVVSGRLFAVPLPWPKLQSLTLALMPGAIVVVCGDPGVGKTFWILDCLRYWTDHGYDAAAFFVEKDRKFYLRRLLAQQEGRAEFSEIGWWTGNPELVREAMERNRATLDALGERITVEGTKGRMDLRRLVGWIEGELRSGRRIIVIDPITAVDAGEDRWRADDAFMGEMQKLLNRYGASLVLVTHPRKGNVTQKSGHDMAAGAAYFRFSDTTLWLNRLAKKKRFHVYGEYGPSVVDTDLLVEIHKAREGKGTSQEVAMTFGNGLHFAEHGVVLGESNNVTDDDPAPVKAMNSDELNRAILKLTKTFPQKFNQEQGRAIKREFARFGLRDVEAAIDAHYATHGDKPDIATLIAKLKG